MQHRDANRKTERERERSRGIHSSISVIYREEGVPPQLHLRGKINSRDILTKRAHAHTAHPVIYLLGLVFACLSWILFACLVWYDYSKKKRVNQEKDQYEDKYGIYSWLELKPLYKEICFQISDEWCFWLLMTISSNSITTVYLCSY